MKIDDKVITLVDKHEVPKGTFGIVDSIEGKNIWVAVYIPANSDTPWDIMRYTEKELKLQ